MNRFAQTDARVDVHYPMPRKGTGTAIQLLRFGVGGVAVNLALYVVYLVLLHLGVEYRAAMSVVYCVGTVLGFVLHRRWTFRNQGAWRRAFGRYVAAYAIGYLLNLVGLWLLVDVTRQPAAVAQGFMILVVAGFLFVVQKLWVFHKVA